MQTHCNIADGLCLCDELGLERLRALVGGDEGQDVPKDSSDTQDGSNARGRVGERDLEIMTSFGAGGVVQRPALHLIDSHFAICR